MEDNAQRLIEKMEKGRGFGRLWRRQLAEIDPQFMELYHNTATYTMREGALPLKMKEIIAVIVNALQFYEPGVRIHLRNALKAGATQQEVIEALEVITLAGIHNLSRSLPAVVEEIDDYKKGVVKSDVFADKDVAK